MKSFFKKLSLVLAAAMVITMLPAQIAKAAPTPLKIRKDSQAKAEATVAPTYNLLVGDQIDITFDGATGYDAAAKLTKKWDSKDKTVATVDGNGLIKALKPGTTVIKITCTAKGVDYEGTATVNVSDSKLEVRQTAQDTITAFFANEAEATAAAKNAKIYLVQRAQKTTRLRDARVTPKAVEDTVVFAGLADGLEYQVSIAGGTYDFVMSVGDPYKIELTYPVVKVGKGVDLTNAGVTTKTSTPEIKVYDADGKILTYDKNKISFKQLEKKGNANLTTSGTSKGNVTFTNGNTESEVKVQVTYKFQDSAKKEQSITAVAYAQVDAYVIPTLGGWAESIVAVKPGTEAKKISYPTTDEFSKELNVGDKVELAYYFLASDGVKYTGANVAGTAAYTVDNSNKILPIANTDYKFYFEKDDTNKICVSLPSPESQLAGGNNKVTVTAWKEGSEVISLYRAKDKNKADSKVDMYLGSITLKVNAERVIDRIAVDENSVTGFIDAANKKVEVPVTVYDQYGDVIGTDIKVVQPASTGNGVSVSAIDDEKGTGKVTFDFSKIQKTSADAPITVKLTADYSDVVTEITVYAFKLADNTEATPEYVLEVDSKKAIAKNVDFSTATSAAQLGISIKVAQSILGVKKDNVSFRLVNNNFEEDAACPNNNNAIYVVVYDGDGKPVSADVEKTIVARTSTAVATATSFGSAASEEFIFDLYKDATNVADGLYAAGTYRIVAYQVTDGFAQMLGDPVIVEVGNKMELIQSVDSTYQLTVDSNKAVVRAKNSENKDIAVTTATGTYSDALVATIVGQLYGWFDINSDTKATSDEVDTIAALTGGFTVNKALSKYYAGTTGEVYINYVTIEFATVDGAKVQQRITVDRKFKIN